MTAYRAEFFTLEDVKRLKVKPTEKKPQRALNHDDMLEALTKLQTRSEEIFGR
ncbi:MAG: hypothetical protein LBE52_12550 [Providencia sp.]|jgi:hypothetical protein|nr:hypothetical protein [Providencia sp.]